MSSAHSSFPSRRLALLVGAGSRGEHRQQSDGARAVGALLRGEG